MLILTSSPNDYYKNIFEEDIEKEYYRTYNWGYFDKSIRILTNAKLNWLVPSFIKNIIFKMNLPKEVFLKKRKKLTFVFMQGGILGFNKDYINYLKRTFSNARFVMYITNPASTIKKCNIDILSNFYDLVYSYDFDDCKNYNWIYYPLFYKKIKTCSQKKYKESDVFFCGKAKDRLDDIFEAYNALTAKGLDCMFFLVDVDVAKRIERKGIIYVDYLSYNDYIGYLKNTKCVLDIVQKISNGFTLRCCEAVAYDKILITNNVFIKRANFYNERYIIIINKNNIKSLKIDLNINSIQYKCKEDLLPERFLERISAEQSL